MVSDVVLVFRVVNDVLLMNWWRLVPYYSLKKSLTSVRSLRKENLSRLIYAIMLYNFFVLFPSHSYPLYLLLFFKLNPSLSSKNLSISLMLTYLPENTFPIEPWYLDLYLISNSTFLLKIKCNNLISKFMYKMGTIKKLIL